MRVVAPFTLTEREVAEGPPVEELFARALGSYPVWREKSVAERASLLAKGLVQLQAKKGEIAVFIAEEMGKPIKHALLELERCEEEWSYMLSHAESFLAPERVEGAEIHFAPLGVVAVISPWNFPLLLPLRGIIPALLAGNSVVFKPSELSPRVGIAIGELFESEVPLLVAVGDKAVGARLVSLPVRAIAFTGSTSVGKSIAAHAAQSLKRVILELGGLDAAIVCCDADIEHAAREIVKANARNTGQVCNAVKRVLVHADVYDEFVRIARTAAQTLVYGDPLDEKTDVGPLVSKTQHDRVKEFLEDAQSRGAKVFSVDVSSQGYLFPQRILTDVPLEARLLREEPFGPLLPIIPFTTDEEAIRIANGTPYGLTASVWSKDATRARTIATQLEVGLVRHNTHAAMHSGIPWGGCKESGVGRMKTKEGLREFTDVRVVA
jgi:acyl-CoA reductase-like NAD-dependent aldehyde dehydrogenase